MKLVLYISIISLFTFKVSAQKKFAQLDLELPTPNEFHNAAGAPGHNYYQQKADYKMALTIDDETQKLYGVETITYTNNSPDRLDYLWLQLDQNIYAENSDSKVIEIEKMENFKSIGDVRKKFFYYDGGFKIEYIKSVSEGVWRSDGPANQNVQCDHNRDAFVASRSVLRFVDRMQTRACSHWINCSLPITAILVSPLRLDVDRTLAKTAYCEALFGRICTSGCDAN